ncbi:MAG: amidohydrolase family protein [Polyangiaceae bacterium]|nr:amidohydrolase family protein [Polyangiaceae bacterium]
MRGFTAASLFDGQRLVEGGAVVVDDDGVVIAAGHREEVARATSAALEPIEGLLMPGLVDAFAMPSDAFLRGRTELGLGFARWLDSVRVARGAADEGEIEDARGRALDAALAHGVAAMADVTTSHSSHAALAARGLGSVTAQQIYGTARYEATVALEAAVAGAPRGARWVPSAHALSTLHPDVARVTLREARRRGGPAMLQADVSPAGRPDRPEQTLAALEEIGALEAGTVVAHVGGLGGAGWRALRDAGVHVVVSPRAALAIELRLPAIGELLAAGLGPSIGTGSPGATGDSDPLADARAVHERFPAAPLEALLRMVTSSPADALGLDRHGRLAPGARPGLLALVGPPAAGVPSAARAWLGRSRVPRRWIVAPRAEAHGTTTAHGA